MEVRNVQQISDLPGFYELVVKAGAGVTVNRETALRHAAVFACVTAISNDLAGLPVHVLQKTSKGVRKVADHPVYEKIKLNPNPEMRAFYWYKTRLTHTLMTGNSYTLIEGSKTSPVKNLWPLDPESVTIERVTNTNTNVRGRIRYTISDGIGRPKHYRPESILHLKGFSWDGVLGQTVISNYAKNQIGIGLELDQFENAFFKNGLNPGGIFTHPKSLGEKNKPGFIKALKKRFGGSKNRGLPMVLEDGMDFKPYEVKMVDQQFLELLKLNKVDICGIFGVPQSRISISDSNTNFNNTEQEKRRYYESGLLPWAIPDEQEMSFRLLTVEDRKQGMFIKYNFDGFLRGDSKTRAEVSRIWSTMGVPVNDLLSLEDRNPVDGGDVGLVQVNMTPLNSISALQDGKNERFLPVFQDALGRIVNRENIALEKEVKKQITNRAKTGFDEWLDDFYGGMSGYINRNIGSLVRLYLMDKPGVADRYVDDYARRYIESSRNQITERRLSGFDLVLGLAAEWRNDRLKVEANTILDDLKEMAGDNER